MPPALDSSVPPAPTPSPGPAVKEQSPDADLVRAAKVFKLVHTPFESLLDILDIGADTEEDADPLTMTAGDAALFDLYGKLKAICPDIGGEVLRRGGTTKVARFMDNAFAAERAVWVNDIKKDIADWHEFTPALTSDQKGKSQRGVLHPTCHELLAPWNFDLKDPIVVDNIASGKDGFRLHEGVLGRFWWLNFVRHDDIDIGFLKSTLVAKALRRILFGELAATSGVTAEHDIATCRARKFDLYTVSLGMIFLAGCLVHYALDATIRFGFDSPAFNYREYYCTLVKATNKMSVTARKELLMWYQERVMPRETRKRKQEQRSEEAQTADWMEAERAAKRRRDQGAADAGADAAADAIALGDGAKAVVEAASKAAAAFASAHGASEEGAEAAGAAAAEAAAEAVAEAGTGAAGEEGDESVAGSAA